MKDLPYFPLYAAEIEAETAYLSIEEDGVYNRLLRQMWMQPGCSLPADEKWLCRRLRVTTDQFTQVVKPVIKEFFETRRGRIHSPRLIAEFEKISETREKRSSAGKKGANARKGLKTQTNDVSRAPTNNQPGSSNIYSDEEADLEADTEANRDEDTDTPGNPGVVCVAGEKVVRFSPKNGGPSEAEKTNEVEKYVGGIAPGYASVIDEFKAVWAFWAWRERDVDERPDEDIEGKTRAAYCIARAKASCATITAGLVQYTNDRIGEDDEFTKRLRNWLHEERWLDEYEETTPPGGEPDFLAQAGSDAMDGWL